MIYGVIVLAKEIHFNPSGKTFVFNFNEYSCFEKATGVCLLTASQDLINNNSDLPGKFVSSRCKKILELIETKYFEPYYPVSIQKHKCGHYGVPDGQHRTCIAGTANINVYSYEIQNVNELCDWCKDPNERTNIYFLKTV